MIAAGWTHLTNAEQALILIVLCCCSIGMHIPQEPGHAALRLPSLLPNGDLSNTCTPVENFTVPIFKLFQSIASQSGQLSELPK